MFVMRKCAGELVDERFEWHLAPMDLQQDLCPEVDRLPELAAGA
jgi:hypothetical protein